MQSWTSMDKIFIFKDIVRALGPFTLKHESINVELGRRCFELKMIEKSIHVSRKMAQQLNLNDFK